MPSTKQGLDAEEAEKSDAPISSQVSLNEHLDASRVEKTGTSRSPPEPGRWVPHRKAEVVAAVRGGLISLAEARSRYAMSLEEYLTWQREIDRFGLAGLRVYKARKSQRDGSLSTEQ